MSGRHSNSNLLKNDSISLKEEIQNSKYEHVEFFTCSSCERIWQIGYPSILAFGLIGNALCFAAFAAHKLRHETRLLCSLCAAFDSLALIASFASRWPDAAFGISALNPVLCHVLVTANYWLPELAAWTLVYLTVERFTSGENFMILEIHINYTVQQKKHCIFDEYRLIAKYPRKSVLKLLVPNL